MILRIVANLCGIFLMVLVGCSSSSTSPTDTDPNITGTSFLRADVNGFAFKCNSITNMGTEIAPTVTVTPVDGGKYSVYISGESYSFSGGVTLSVTCEIPGTTGTYNIGNTGSVAYISSTYNTGSLSTAGLYSSEDKDPGTLTITSFNTSKRRIAGTFTSNLFRQLSSPVTIPATDGKFEIGY